MSIFSNFWARAAFLFDTVQIFFNGNFWEVFEKKFGNQVGRRILDLACGTGELRAHINPEVYLGIDINPSYIRYAKKRFKDMSASFIVGSITNSIPKRGFDQAFLISTAHHLSDDQMYKVCRLVRKAGVKAFVVIDGVPVGRAAFLLSWLDRALAGGKYFRSQEKLARLIRQYFKIESGGTFSAKRSFYKYPYVVAYNK